VRLQGLQTEKEGVMDQDLKELRNDIRCMDMNELTAFGRKHRADPDSVEYLEAKAEWKRRQQKKAEVPKPQLVGPTSEEFAQMAKAAGPDRYPWIWYEDGKA
jgi:hypothetical protein